MRLDTLKWNDHTFKELIKEAKLIYCFLEAHCSTAGFLQAENRTSLMALEWSVDLVLILLVMWLFSLLKN